MKSFFKILFASFIGALLALVLSGLFFFSLMGSMVAFAEKATPKVPASAILKLNFQTAIGEQDAEGLFDLSSLSPIPIGGGTAASTGILTYVKAINEAANDPAIKFIYMNPTWLSASITHIEEVRQALQNFRASGKPIIVYAESFTQGAYYLSSVADKIYIHPLCANEIIGVSANIMFFKDILDKLGVDVQLIRHGKYKAAGEQFVNSDISEANREQNQAMVDALWRSMSGSICESRSITSEDFNYLVDNLLINSSEQMVDAKLADEIVTRDQMMTKLCELFGVEKEKELKMIGIEDYAAARIKPNIKAKAKIAVLYANGEITLGKGEEISSDKYAEIISKIRKDSTIKAVVMRVNSPGGNAQAAEIIRNELILLKEAKPLIVSYGEYAASGGYWISADADKIYTNNTTLTGSIGVFSMIPSFQKVMKETAHVNTVAISTNKHSDMFSLMRPLDKVEVAAMQSSVEIIYDKFVSIVAQGREMTTERVDEIAQGRVWAGNDALQINLTDQYGGLQDAIDYAASLADVSSYRLVEYPTVKTGMEKMLETFGQAKATVETVADPETLVESIYLEMKANKGVCARSPYIYKFN